MPRFNVVSGICATPASAERAVEELRSGGFSFDDISVLIASPDTVIDFARVETPKVCGASANRAAGPTLGSVVGWLSGAGVLVIPGAGPFIAAGPIIGAIAGADVGGPFRALSAALVAIGVPEHAAESYEARVKQGRVLVAVRAEDMERATTARILLEQIGVENITGPGESPTP